MAKHIYSVNSFILRNSIYNEGRMAAESNLSIKICPYDIRTKRVSRDVWMTGYNNYVFEKNLEIQSYAALI